MTPDASGRSRPVTAGRARRLVAGLTLTTLAGCSLTSPAPPVSDVAAAAAASATGAGPRATPHPSAPSTTRDPSTTSDPSATSDPVDPPPYVASVRWVTTRTGRSLQVRPTASGRTTTALYPEAWAQVLRLAPGADTPGMRAQFSCHWTFARALDPAKPSWNLEPWRPVVSTTDMLSAGCNPGGGQE